MNRIDRLTAIIIYLEGRQRVTIEELADRYSISERTVFRDLKALQEAGVPITSEPGAGYYIVKGYHLPPVMFNKNEAASLLAGERLMQKWSNSELSKSYLSALDKIRSTLPSEDKEYFEELDKLIKVFPHQNKKESTTDDHIFTFLQNAIFKKEVIKIDYLRPYSKETTSRKVEPMALLVMGNNWYLAAWCLLREGYRLFRLDRFEKFSLTGIKIPQPPKHTLKDYYEEDLSTEKELTKVVLWFDKEIIRYVGDQKYWHGWAWEKEVGDGIEMTLLCASLDYLSHWLLTWVSSVRVQEPQELKDKMKNFSKELFEHYS